MALFIYLLLLLFYALINANGQIILTDISKAESYNQYPTQSSSDTCLFEFYFSAVDTAQPGGGFIFGTDPLTGIVTEILKNDSSVLYLLRTNQPINTYTTIVSVTKNLETQYKTIQYKCERIDTDATDFKITYTDLTNIPRTIFNIEIPYGHFEITGLKYKIQNLMLEGPDGGRIPYKSEPNGMNIFKVTNVNSLTQYGHILNYMVIIGDYYKSKIFSILPPINPTSNNSENVLSIIPPSKETMFEYCFGCSAYYSIKIKISDYYPFIGVKTDLVLDAYPYPVHGDSSGITYYGRIYDKISDDVNPLKISAFSQYGSNLVNFANASIIIKMKLPNTFVKQGLYYSIDPLGYSKMFTNTFNSLDSYDYFPYFYDFLNSYTQISSPFCLSGNNQAFTCKASFLIRLKGTGLDSFTFGSSYFFDSWPLVQELETNLPEVTILTSLEIIPLYNQYYLYKIGVNRITYFSFIQIESKYYSYGYESVTVGSGAVFEIIVDSITTKPIITIGDIYGRTKVYNVNDYYSISPALQFTIPKRQVNLYTIQDISFLYNEIDVTNKSVANILYFNFGSDIDRSTIPNIAMSLLDPVSFDVGGEGHNNKNTFYSKYNNDLKKYQIEFKVPANTMAGILPFSLGYSNNFKLKNDNLPESAQLYVKSTKFDSRGPIFIDFVMVASSVSPNYIYWQFTIDSSSNGFDYGNITVRGNMDASIYKFNLTPANVIRGDKYIGSYIIKVDLPDVCVTQKYVIEKIQLFDTQDVRSYFSISESNLPILRTPFINYLGEPTSITEITTQSCTALTPSVPELVSFNAELKINSLGDTQSILFTFSAQDVTNGLKANQYPVVYITTDNLKTIECHSTYVDTIGTADNFKCLIDLPYGFGYKSDIIFSVYGIISNSGNYIGYSAFELMALNFDYFMSDLSLISKMVITETSSITSNGGDLWLIGKDFKFSNLDYLVLIKYSGESDFTSLPTPTVFHQTALLVENIKKTKLPFTIKIKKSQQSIVESNEFIVTPIDFDYTPPTPVITNAPQTCSSGCGGTTQGYCSSTGCICYSPWIGNDCTSKVLIISQPSTNTTHPSTEIPIGTETGSGNITSNYLYKSLISLVSIREFDFDSVVVNEYTFDKWIYNELDSSTNEYYTNITVPSIDGIAASTITSIKVKVQWFKDLTNITFGNEQLIMNPSSIKYTIELSNYNFKSNLNTLQLIMSASLSSSRSNDICSSKEFGETTSGDNSNFVKIQIQDHSLYGRFIKRAIVDYMVKSIENTPLDSSLNAISSASSSQSFIGINIPHYKSLLIIDPDFSVLVNNNDASDSDNSICTSSSRLTTAQLAGIIVGAGVIFIAIASVGAFMLIKRRKHTLLILGVRDILMHKTNK